MDRLRRLEDLVRKVEQLLVLAVLFLDSVIRSAIRFCTLSARCFACSISTGFGSSDRCDIRSRTAEWSLVEPFLLPTAVDSGFIRAPLRFRALRARRAQGLKGSKFRFIAG